MPERLEARIHAAAERSGESAHSIIPKAIEEKTDRLEQQAAFLDQADQRFRQLAEGGEKITWDDMQAYLTWLAAGGETASANVTAMAKG